MMNQNILRTVDVKVDMRRINRVVNTRATFNQKDVKTAVILCRLSMDNPMDLTGCDVVAEILKSDGKQVVILGQILDPTNGVIALGLTEQCLTTIGEVRCELTIRSNTQTLYSPVLLYTVNDNLFDLENEVIISLNEYPILTQLISNVQNIEQGLYTLETLIQATEFDRNSNESIRIQNENDRELYIKQVKSDITSMVTIFNEKVQLVSDEIFKMNTQVTDTITEVNTIVMNKISEMNTIIERVNTTLSDRVSIFDDRVILIDSKIKEITTTITNLTNATNTNINNMINSTNTKMSEMNKIINDNIEFVTGKTAEIDTKVADTNKLITDVETAENNRNQAEINRQTSYDELIAELEVTSGDIDDIINMVGGL